jgi:uracil-DNA glycosylase family 4
MPFQNVLGGERPKRTFIGETPKKPKLSAKEVGCEFCPLNTVPGIHKVIGTVHGRDVFIWGMAPGPDENREGREFIGKSGKLLWQELKRVGISREMCDVQNVVRCYPADRDEDEYPALKMRNPTAEEIHCCSIYTKRALEKQQAKVHLVFGEIAAKALLGSEFKKGKKQFWSEKLNGYVLCIWHPSYFIRMGYYAGGTQPPNDKFKQWRADFELAAKLLGRKDRYEYVKGMNYIPVTKRAQAIEMYRRIERAATKDWRVVVDVEDGVLKSGRKAILMIGFCYSVGTSYVLCLDHRKGVAISDEDRAFNWKIARRILRDSSIKKTLHHGSYDAGVQLRLMGVEMQGFDYDTEFGEYFSDPEAKAYGLTKITERRFPEFSGYKEIVTPECYTPEFLATIPQNSKMSPTKKYDRARKKNGLNYALVPWSKMVVYNGADCDVTKRVEVSTRERSNPALMHVYIDSSYLTARMEKDGPLLDYRHHAKVMQLYDVRVPRLKKQIQDIAGNPEFNPGSTKQVPNLLYRQLGLEMPETEDGKENTRVETLELMTGQHEVVQLILDYRRAAKLKSTYMDGFKRSADMHNGNITTKWWLTGTATGRMSSGAGREKKEDAESGQGLVNLQNIVFDVQLQNLLISDERWRAIYQYWKKHGPFTEATWRQFEDVDVFLGFDQGQFEMRVMAQRCGDKNLIGVFERGEDIHAEVGHQLMGLDKEILMEESPERVAVKGMHFGLVYGLKAKGLWDHLRSEYIKRKMKFDKTVAWVQNLLDSYFAKYPKVARMIEGDHHHAEEFGWVETMFGFRRPIDVEGQKAAGAAWTGAYWANQSANTPIQGTAHQLLLIGLVPLIRQPERYALLQRPKMEIHDAIYFIVKLKDMWKAALLGQDMLEKESLKIVREEFKLDWKVPLKAEPKAGFRFGTMVKNVGVGSGPKTTSEFLNQSCEKIQKAQQALAEELGKLAA